MTITVTLFSQQRLNDVCPITIVTSGTSSTRITQDSDKKLMKEVHNFLCEQFNYDCYDAETKQDVATLDLNKYVANMVNEAISNLTVDDLDRSNRNYASPHSFCTADFVNEYYVYYGLIHLPGEEAETVSALFKLYFTGRDIKFIEY